MLSLVLILSLVLMLAVSGCCQQLMELVNSAGDMTSCEYVEGVSFSNITFMHSAVETTSCFSGPCDGQSADFLQTATIHLTGAKSWSFDSVTVTHTGGGPSGHNHRARTHTHTHTCTSFSLLAVRRLLSSPRFPLIGMSKHLKTLVISVFQVFSS